jgi:hypothetical protein
MQRGDARGSLRWGNGALVFASVPRVGPAGLAVRP